MQDQEVPAVVIENGSGWMKAGFAGDDTPRTVFPTIIGYPQSQEKALDGQQHSDFYIGEEAKNNHEMLTMKCPIQEGCVDFRGWEDMERIWHHVYKNKLQVSSKDHPVLLTESRNLGSTREKMTEIMFETFAVPSMYTIEKAVGSLFCSGRTTGMVLQSGEQVTSAVPIYEGHAISHISLCYGGSDITDALGHSLAQRGYDLRTTDGLDILRDIKKKLCYVALDFEQEMSIVTSSSSLDKSYELPDGQVITVGKERFRSTEGLFDTSYFCLENSGVHGLIEEHLGYDVDFRICLLSDIIMSGGNIRFPGLRERLHKELSTLNPHQRRIRIISLSNTICPAWVGGSILASLSSFEKMVISKQEYEDHGPRIVKLKCF